MEGLRSRIIAAAAAVVLLAAALLASSGLTKGGGGTIAGAGVRINEILASNGNYPNSDGALCDWIELHNTTDTEINLAGWKLTDDEQIIRYVFPADVTIPAKGYLVVSCDGKGRYEGPLYADFGVSRSGGETVLLMNRHSSIISSVETVETSANCPMAVVDGAWTVLSYATPGFENSEAGYARYMASASGSCPVRLSEMMSSNSLYPDGAGNISDWVELYNDSPAAFDLGGYALTDNGETARYYFAGGTEIGAYGYLVAYCGEAFGLSRDGGETVALLDPASAVVDSVELPSLERNHSLAKTAEGWRISDRATPGYGNDEAGYEEYLASTGVADCTVYISELMASNLCTVTDARGEFSDWVELTNYGGGTVELEGFYLSDDESEPAKWRIPSLSLAPGESKLIFCTGEGGDSASFSLSRSGETVILASPAGVAIDKLSYVNLSDDRSICRNAPQGELYETLYATPGLPNTEESRVLFASREVAAGPLTINEALTANGGYMAQRGEYYDIVELKNSSSETINLSDYYLSDDCDEPLLWRLPDTELEPGELYVVFCSGDAALNTGKWPHAPFALNAAEDRLYVSDKSGRVRDYALLRGIPSGGSYGRMEGETGYFYFTEPTPGAENKAGERGVARTPESDAASGVYEGVDGLSVSLTGEGEIYYTLDGSTPTERSERYRKPIEVTETTVIRAVSVSPGKLPSAPLTLSYIVNEGHTLPVLSLVTDPDSLWGVNGIYDNYSKGWERGASLSFFEDGGSFTVDCGIQMHGRTSLAVSKKKTFKVVFRAGYGASRLNYDVFGDGETDSFDSLLVRASTEDVYTSYIRDELAAEMAYRSGDLLAQNYRYCILYINGEYWGVYAIREHHGEEYYSSHTGVSTEDVTVLRGSYTEAVEMGRLNSFAGTDEIATDAGYEYVDSHVDLDALIDWIIIESYSGNLDVYSNLRIYHSDEGDGKWRYALADFDLAFMDHETWEVGFETNGQLHGILPTGLMKNATFRDRFLTRLAELLGGAFSDENVLAMVHELADGIRAETPRDLERWNQNARLFDNQISNIERFITRPGRAGEMISDARSFFGLTEADMEYYFGELD